MGNTIEIDKTLTPQTAEEKGCVWDADIDLDQIDQSFANLLQEGYYKLGLPKVEEEGTAGLYRTL